MSNLWDKIFGTVPPPPPVEYVEYWVASYTCIKCENYLSDEQRTLNNGVCMYCGYVSPGYVCETVKVPYKVRSPKYGSN